MPGETPYKPSSCCGEGHLCTSHRSAPEFVDLAIDRAFPEGDPSRGAAARSNRQEAGHARPGMSSEHTGEVIGFSQGGDVLVRLRDGREIEIPLVDEIRDRFEVGSPALIYFDGNGILVGWYLPDAGIGVDLRNRRPP
jgi:hypothetical protein